MTSPTSSNIHVALYGNVAMLRGTCTDCASASIIQDGTWGCCGERAPVPPAILQYQQIAEPSHLRKNGPTTPVKQAIINAQDNRCLYCERGFGTYVPDISNPAKLVRLKVCWDHLVPFAYRQDNSDQNFVAACQQCNAMKHSRMFQTVEEARIYLTGELRRRYERPSAGKRLPVSVRGG